MTGLRRRLIIGFIFITCVFISECVIATELLRYDAVSESEMVSSISSMSTRSKIVCGALCHGNEECISFSFNNATEICKLNNKVPLTAPGEVVARNGSTLYHVKEEGWRLNQETGHRYVFVTTHQNWESAKSYCESIGASLVKIEDDREQQYLRKILKADFTWESFFLIGARYNDGSYRWTDGTNVSYNGWAPNKPGNTTGCVDILRFEDWLWNPYGDCNGIKAKYICEKGL